MRKLPELFERNRIWSERMKSQDPSMFERLAGAQRPKYLWIGCSDSRVPANQIVDLPPGEVFADMNLLSMAWVYGLEDGRLRDLAFAAAGISEVDESYRVAVEGS